MGSQSLSALGHSLPQSLAVGLDTDLVISSKPTGAEVGRRCFQDSQARTLSHQPQWARCPSLSQQCQSSVFPVTRQRPQNHHISKKLIYLAPPDWCNWGSLTRRSHICAHTTPPTATALRPPAPCPPALGRPLALQPLPPWVPWGERARGEPAGPHHQLLAGQSGAQLLLPF